MHDVDRHPAVAEALAVPIAVGARLGRLLDAFAAVDGGAGLDALVITDLLNVRYLTGFTGGAATLVVGPGAATLVTDGRYGVLAESDTAGAGVTVEVTADDGRGAITSALGAARRVGLEADHVSWSRQRVFADWLSGREVVATTRVVEQLRFVKDDGELARIRAAATITDEVVQDAPVLMADGPTEAELRDYLDAHLGALGSEAPAFPTIVAAGPNGALPHHRPGAHRIAAGEAVLIDFGATVDGYRSDLSRTFLVGDVGPRLTEVYDVVLAAQLAGLAAVRDGVPAADVDRAARAVIEAAGYGEQFVHSTGHGVGLYIHEDPWVSWRSDDVLGARHVITIEPGVYLPGLGGVRIEDLVVVTPHGPELLSHTPKDRPWAASPSRPA